MNRKDLFEGGRGYFVMIAFYMLVEDLKTVFELLTQEGLEVRTAGEYQLKAKYDGVPIDLLFADHYVGADVVRRAISVPLGERKRFLRHDSLFPPGNFWPPTS